MLSESIAPVSSFVQLCCIQHFGTTVNRVQRRFTCVEKHIFEHEEEGGIEDRLSQLWCDTCLSDMPKSIEMIPL